MQQQITDHTDTVSCILLNLQDCDEMIDEGASAKAVKAFLEIAVGCYGKEMMLNVIADFGNAQHKKYAAILRAI